MLSSYETHEIFIKNYTMFGHLGIKLEQCVNTDIYQIRAVCEHRHVFHTSSINALHIINSTTYLLQTVLKYTEVYKLSKHSIV